MDDYCCDTTMRYDHAVGHALPMLRRTASLFMGSVANLLASSMHASIFLQLLAIILIDWCALAVFQMGLAQNC